MARSQLPHERTAGRRVVIERVRPSVDDGRFPVKRTVGEGLTVTADVFADGHDIVCASLRWRHESEDAWIETPMDDLGNDVFAAAFVPDRLGRYSYEVRGFVDPFATWRAAMVKRLAAAQDIAVDLEIGAQILDGLVSRDPTGVVARAAARLRAGDLTALEEPSLGESARAAADADRQTVSTSYTLAVDRPRARFSAWYELFPRSIADGDAVRHGTFRDAERRLRYIADMGFNVVYLPPIHPIGITHRKGPNNSLVGRAGDVGSPWAIGSAEGGHTAVHPELGSLADFGRFRHAAEDLGMEVALDVAFQCSPDHPWVHEHPEWFRARPDGTLQYAENPPKRYEDIYPFDFESPEWRSLWRALRQVFEFWIEQGVRVFRVDNPHTKPFAFWEWALGDLRSRYSDLIFLAEAFTRPRVMERLAKVGFNQSYTYFTWRNEAWELREYFEELTKTELVEYLRPNVWTNTPDILSEFLQHGGREAFAIRAVLAATLAASYGIYGPAFELCEHVAREAGSEEYRDSEKYQLRSWDLARSDSLRPLITRLNQIRVQHVALQSNRGLRFHDTTNPNLLCYSKRDELASDVVLTVVTVDPSQRQEGEVLLDLHEIGVDIGGPFGVRDLLGGEVYEWEGARNYVAFDPSVLPAHVFHFELKPAVPATAPRGAPR